MFSNSLLGISPREIKLSTQNPVCDINGDDHKVEPSKDLSMNEWTVMYLHSTMLFDNKKKRVHAPTHGNSSKHAEKQATLMSLIYCRGTGTRRSTEWVPDWPEIHIRNKTQHKAVYGSVCVLCLRWRSNRNKKSLGGCQAGGERKRVVEIRSGILKLF